MDFLKKILEKQKPMFEKGGKLHRFYYLFEAGESFMFTPATTTTGDGTQIKDAVDLKRMIFTVVIAMIPCMIFGVWNIGHQHSIATGSLLSELEKFTIGAGVFLPIFLVSFASGGLVEAIFAIIRKHPINEGYMVTGFLIPLVMPPTVPLWQVGLAAVFAVIFAKEAFGGTGMNVLNVAMTARAFLYFAYPQQLSGEVWTFLGGKETVEGYSGQTSLALAADVSRLKGDQATTVVDGFLDFSASGLWSEGLFTFKSMFLGIMPGSIGETSTLMCLIGALILILAGVGSYKIILSVFGGAYAMGALFNFIYSSTSLKFEFFALPPEYHLVMGGLAFGAVFMATDPVTATHTEKGKWIYGFLIGALTVIIRTTNPGYAEGIMLAVLLMNVFAPLIDFYIINANKKSRLKRATL